MTLKDFIKNAVVFSEVYTGNGHYEMDNIVGHSEFDELMDCDIFDTQDKDLKYLHDTEDGIWVFAREDVSRYWILTRVK